MSDTNDDFDFDALLDATESTQKPEEAPTPPAKPSLPPAETDDLPDLQAVPQVSPPTTMASPPDDGDDPDTFMGSTGIQVQREVPDITKPWMQHHTFKLVSSIEELEKLIDECIAAGKCSLDLETQGLDSRSERDENGKLRTVHQIVGFCISPGNAKFGYYAPVRHRPNDGGPDLNLPVAEAEAAISRLCWAAQPVAADGQSDLLSFREFKQKPRVIIDFWNAKFDQEFLYPVTGIDWWHPDSFEDGMLACFVLKSEDKGLGLKYKAPEILRDPEGNPYEMIKLKELFPNGRKIQFDSLAPDEPGVVKYACSDAVCTRLLCEHPEVVGRVRDPSRARDLGFIYRLEKQCTQVVRVMERNRVRVDREKFRQLLEVHLRKREEIRTQIVKLAESKGFHGFEPGQTTVLSEFLFGERGLDIKPKPEKNEASGQYKTDASSIEQLVQEIGEEHAPAILKWIIEWREQDKVIGTYLEKLVANPDKNSELRFGFKETGAATGRFSAPQGEADQGYSAVPIHGIPSTSALREGFIAREGYTLVKSDYAGEELRIASNVSGEQVWIKEFLEGEGDLHSITARAFFGKEKVSKEERKMGKCVHPDTIVYVDGRYQAIGKLGEFGTPNEFMERTGTVYDGKSMVGLSALYNGGVTDLVHVVSRAGIVTCTPNHRFLLRDGSWARAGDLAKGALLAEVGLPVIGKSKSTVPLSFSLWEGIPKLSINLTTDHAYFAGLYAGDGYGSSSSAGLTHGESGKQDDYGADYEEWIRLLEEACRKCDFTTSRKDRASLYLGSRVFVRFLDTLGIHRKSSRLLRVPSWIWDGGKEFAQQFLGGLFDTDGTVDGSSPILNFTTKNFVFAGQVTTLLKACGLDFNVELTFNKTYQRHYVRVRLTVDSSYKLKGYLKYSGKRNRLRAPVYEGRGADRFEVTAVLPAGEGHCVDLSVLSGEHRYVANTLITHNTANFALLYGGGPASIMRATGCDKVEASRRKQAFDKAVPTFAKWIKGQHATARKHKGVWTPFGRWIAIPDIDHPEKGVQAACERHAVNYAIQGGGADIMKIALVLCHKEWHKRGWLKNGGDDSVRMLLTVHDEIVFEIRNDRIEEALPLICQIMSSPWKFPGPPFSPRWQVPLIVEPLLGLSWGGTYNWDMMIEGKKQPLKEGEKLEPHEIRVGDKVYHRIPPWLEGLVKPGWERHGHEAVPTPATTSSQAPAATPSETPTPQAPAAPKAAARPAPAPEPARPSSPPPAAGKVTTFAINKLSKHTVHIIGVLCMKARDVDRGTVLRLVDASGSILVDPTMGIRINPEKFKDYILEHTLGDGSYFID